MQHLGLGDSQAVDVQFMATEATQGTGLVLGKDRIEEVGQAAGTQLGIKHAVDRPAERTERVGRPRKRHIRCGSADGTASVLER